MLNRVGLFSTLWSIAFQAPLSMGFSRQEYWSGLPFPSPGDLPDPRIEPTSPLSPALQADSLPAEPLGKTLRARNRSKLPLCLAGLWDIFCTLAELENLLLSE